VQPAPKQKRKNLIIMTNLQWSQTQKNKNKNVNDNETWEKSSTKNQKLHNVESLRRQTKVYKE